jgi:hypothetical protein
MCNIIIFKQINIYLVNSLIKRVNVGEFLNFCMRFLSRRSTSLTAYGVLDV